MKLFCLTKFAELPALIFSLGSYIYEELCYAVVMHALYLGLKVRVMTGAPIENGGGEVVRRVVSIEDFMYGDYNCVRATLAKPQWRNGEDGCLGTTRAASFYESSYARPHGTQETRSDLRIALLILWATRLLITEHSCQEGMAACRNLASSGTRASRNRVFFGDRQSFSCELGLLHSPLLFLFFSLLVFVHRH